jgi:hypothetical protein
MVVKGFLQSELAVVAKLMPVISMSELQLAVQVVKMVGVLLRGGAFICELTLAKLEE